MKFERGDVIQFLEGNENKNATYAKIVAKMEADNGYVYGVCKFTNVEKIVWFTDLEFKKLDAIHSELPDMDKERSKFRAGMFVYDNSDDVAKIVAVYQDIVLMSRNVDGVKAQRQLKQLQQKLLKSLGAEIEESQDDTLMNEAFNVAGEWITVDYLILSGWKIVGGDE